MDTLVNKSVISVFLSNPWIVLYPGEGCWGLGGWGLQVSSSSQGQPIERSISFEPSMLRRMSGDCGRKLEDLD